MSIGFLVDKLDMSDSSICLANFTNKYLDNNPNKSLPVFRLETTYIPYVCRFSVNEAKQAWAFRGSLLATNLKCANILLDLKIPKKKYFYVWDLEWLYRTDMTFEQYSRIYQNDNLELIARSQEHATIIENCWKKPIDIIKDFDYDRTSSIIA